MIHKMIIITLMIAYFGVVRCDVKETEEFANLTDYINRAQKKLSEGDMELSNDLEKIYQVQANLNSKSDDTEDIFLTDNEVVRIQNFKQTFFDFEPHFSSGHNCSKTCEDYENVGYNGNGCSGSVRSCVTSDVDVTVVLQHPQKDRIYDVLITHDQCPTCASDYIVSGNQRTMYSGLRWYDTCGVCSCTCDQHNSENTIRRFYLGEIKAPSEYVVTGTRFVEHNRTIFLQIQVGKMVTLGLIDQETVQWQDLPNDTDDNQYFSLTYDKDSVIFNSDSCAGADGVVGFMFEEWEYGVRLRTIKIRIANRLLGHLAEPPLDLEYCDPTTESPKWPYIGGTPGLNENIPMEPENMIIKKLIGVRFDTSSFANDGGQSCVPYFDGSDVTHAVEVPLSRIDFIQYTNDENYAGFIRPKLIPHN